MRKCHAKMQSHNPMSPSIAPARRLPNAVIAIWLYMHYAFVRVAMASPQKNMQQNANHVKNTSRSSRNGDNETNARSNFGSGQIPRDPFRDPPLGGASFSRFGDAVLYLAVFCVFWCIEKHEVQLFSQKHTTLCELCARLPPKMEPFKIAT